MKPRALSLLFLCPFELTWHEPAEENPTGTTTTEENLKNRKQTKNYVRNLLYLSSLL